MVFKEMDPELCRRAVEGHKDELTKEAEEQRQLYAKFTCPRCKGSLDEEIDSRTAFTGNGLIAKGLLRCSCCTYAIDPYTNVIVNFGDASKTPVSSIPILGGKYIPDP